MSFFNFGRRLLGVCAAVLVVVLGSTMVCAQGENALFGGDEIIPSDAIVLFDGKDLSQWVMSGSDKPATWKIRDGYMETCDGDIETKQRFKDCQVHVEFWVPLMPDAQGQARGNSGIFFMGWSYEVQILDSYKQPLDKGNCGGIFSIHAPLANACRPPEVWQSYDIVFHAPRFDETGKKTANARATVFQNGVLVQDNADIPFTTPGHSLDEPKEAGPFRLQYHGNTVRFRNVWIRAIDGGK